MNNQKKKKKEGEKNQNKYLHLAVIKYVQHYLLLCIEASGG